MSAWSMAISRNTRKKVTHSKRTEENKQETPSGRDSTLFRNPGWTARARMRIPKEARQQYVQFCAFGPSKPVKAILTPSMAVHKKHTPLRRILCTSHLQHCLRLRQAVRDPFLARCPGGGIRLLGAVGVNSIGLIFWVHIRRAYQCYASNTSETGDGVERADHEGGNSALGNTACHRLSLVKSHDALKTWQTAHK